MREKKKRRKRFVAPRVSDAEEGARKMGAPVQVKSTLSKRPNVKQRKPPYIAPKVSVKIKALGHETGTEIINPAEVRFVFEQS
jgi:hypothetical protein